MIAPASRGTRVFARMPTADAWVVLVYTLGYMAADFISQRYAAASSTSAFWNPAVGLGFILVSLYGRRFTAAIPIVSLISALVLRGPDETAATSALEALATGVIYAIAAGFLSSTYSGFERSLSSVASMIVLLLTAVLSSAAASVLFHFSMILAGQMRLESALGPALRFWIADMIGIATIVPLGLMLLQNRWAWRWTPAAIGQCLAICVLVGVAIEFREYGRFPYFYFLFFPVIWVALTSGVEGVSAALAIVQVGMLASLALLKMEDFDVTDFQARMIALAATGLVAGGLVTERRKTQEETRLRLEALAQIEMRGSMRELGAAIAHEVNQPLSAAGTYAGLVVESLASETLRDPTALDNAKKVVRQIDRSSQVIKRLRALVRLSKEEQAPNNVAQILDDVCELAQSEALRNGIDLRISVAPGVVTLKVDKLQIEQALLNLVRNSIESISDADSHDRAITLFTRELPRGRTEVGVMDTGPGFPSTFALDRLQAFSSTKPDGLGVGLALCQSIAAANGAELSVKQNAPGTAVSLIFDAERRVPHG